MTEHMVNFTKLGLWFHHNASLIKNAYAFQTELGDFVFRNKKKDEKEKKKNNNRCIIVIQ